MILKNISLLSFLTLGLCCSPSLWAMDPPLEDKTGLVFAKPPLSPAESDERSDLTSFTKRDLGGNEIEIAEAKALVSGDLTPLTSLDLKENVVGTEGVQALASGNLTALTKLNLYYNQIGDEGAQTFASGNLLFLNELNLRANND